MTIFGDRALHRLNEATWAGCNLIWVVFLLEEKILAHRWIPRVHIHWERTTCRSNKRTAMCKPRREASGGITLPAPWPWTSHSQKFEKINFRCLRHPVRDILLWQLRQTNSLVPISLANKRIRNFTHPPSSSFSSGSSLENGSATS